MFNRKKLKEIENLIWEIQNPKKFKYNEICYSFNYSGIIDIYPYAVWEYKTINCEIRKDDFGIMRYWETDRDIFLREKGICTKAEAIEILKTCKYKYLEFYTTLSDKETQIYDLKQYLK